MKKIVFDFSKIKNESQLNEFLAEILNLPSLINGEYGYNLSAFRDVYSYLNDEDFFELTNISDINDSEFLEIIQIFINILRDLKETNPNFDFKISE